MQHRFESVSACEPPQCSVGRHKLEMLAVASAGYTSHYLRRCKLSCSPDRIGRRAACLQASSPNVKFHRGSDCNRIERMFLLGRLLPHAICIRTLNFGRHRSAACNPNASFVRITKNVRSSARLSRSRPALNMIATSPSTVGVERICWTELTGSCLPRQTHLKATPPALPRSSSL
jgi:hypothetical protein